jgi:hypothetical protein
MVSPLTEALRRAAGLISATASRFGREDEHTLSEFRCQSASDGADGGPVRGSHEIMTDLHRYTLAGLIVNRAARDASYASQYADRVALARRVLAEMPHGDDPANWQVDGTYGHEGRMTRVIRPRKCRSTPPR